MTAFLASWNRKRRGKKKGGKKRSCIVVRQSLAHANYHGAKREGGGKKKGEEGEEEEPGLRTKPIPIFDANGCKNRTKKRKKKKGKGKGRNRTCRMCISPPVFPCVVRSSKGKKEKTGEKGRVVCPEDQNNWTAFHFRLPGPMGRRCGGEKEKKGKKREGKERKDGRRRLLRGKFYALFTPGR